QRQLLKELQRKAVLLVAHAAAHAPLVYRTRSLAPMSQPSNPSRAGMKRHRPAAVQSAMSPAWPDQSPVGAAATIHRLPMSPLVVTGGAVSVRDSTTSCTSASSSCNASLTATQGCRLFDGTSSSPMFGVVLIR